MKRHFREWYETRKTENKSKKQKYIPEAQINKNYRVSNVKVLKKERQIRKRGDKVFRAAN